MAQTKYVSVNKTKLYGAKPALELLWGDRVRVLSTSGSRSRVRARGVEGEVETAHLGDESLLEVYFLDVQQGDAVLIRTPDGRHVLIDGGQVRERQLTKKNASDFVDWKFSKDYGATAITLDAVVASHNDADHFGGLLDLLSGDPARRSQLVCSAVTAEQFFHAGVSWWAAGTGRTLGQVAKMKGRSYLVRLLDGRASAEAAVRNGELAGEWGTFIDAVVKAKTSGGSRTRIARLAAQPGQAGQYLPGFDPSKGASIKVLAPVGFDVNGNAGLRVFDAGTPGSKTTNGNSVVLRLDYKSARILLTGDLNTEAQRLLMEVYAGHREEFACDVAKGCHHGSDDVSLEFLRMMQPAVTVISSGDSESYDHPRPSIVGACAVTGYQRVANDKLVSPLIYSTEIARSYRLVGLDCIRLLGPNASVLLAGKALEAATVELPGKSGAKRLRSPADTMVVNGLIYGLVNVRTDGRKILCATLDEQNQKWNVKELESRF